MKKILMIICGGVVFFPCMVFAAQKCVTFGDLNPPASDYIADRGGVDWSLVYPHITIRGIAVCAKNVGEMGDVVDALEYDDIFYSDSYMTDPNDNVYCWCRMLSPAVTPWVAHGYVGDAGTCLEFCAGYCADGVLMESEFRAAMLGSFGA